MSDSLRALSTEVVTCRLCPRLVRYREQVAREKKKAYETFRYWGRPVPGFGDPAARLLVVGLAPAAHGANRTGRMFTGDLPNGASVWLIRAMHGAGFANQPHSIHRRDGLRLVDAYMTAAVRCAPPGNRPLPREIARCFPFLIREFILLRRVRVIVPLGQIAFAAVLDLHERLGLTLPRPRPRFAHGALFRLGGMIAGQPVPAVLCTYHPSRQNTNTGKLTEQMLDDIFQRARRLLDREDAR
ncbi:MAG: uracil-DNA glycosylase [Armatimonadetes bacterium]|nr:uracil-DNA glycosylase [Armatimonadota bacterium]